MKHLNKQHLLTMAAVFFAAVFVFSAVMLYREYHDQKQSAKAFDNIAALVQTEPTVPEESNAAETGTTEGNEPAGPSAYETYSAVYEQNQDFVGWI